MNSEFSEYELVDRDSAFVSHPEEYFDEVEWRGRISRKKILNAIAIIYTISLFCMYWFIWQPAISATERKTSFYHSPVFFFLLVWIVVTAIPILFCLQGMWKYASKASKVIIETREVARRTYHLENSIERDNPNLQKD